MGNPPCEECTKTNNHCCVASVPYGISEALFYSNLADKLGIESLVYPHPAVNVGLFALVNSSMLDKDISQETCIFFKDGKCSIYDERPPLCRAYGSDYMVCRFEIRGLTTKEEIGKFHITDVKSMEPDRTNTYNRLKNIKGSK